MHVEVECIGCHTRYRVAASLAGRIACCKRCGRRFTVPYRSAVVELGDEDKVERPDPVPVTVETEHEVGRDEDGSIFPFADETTSISEPTRPRSSEPLIPQVLTDLWLPLIVLALAAGCAGYAALTRAIQSPNPAVALGLIGIGLTLYVFVTIPLTMRGLQGAADATGAELPNAFSFQTLAAFTVPTAGLALGYFQSGANGAIFGGSLGLLIAWGLIFVMYRIKVVPAVSAGLASAICYLFSLGIIAAAVAGASVLISLAGLELPWDASEEKVVVAAATVVAPAEPALVVEAPHEPEAVEEAAPEPEPAPEPAPPPPPEPVQPKLIWTAAVDAPTEETSWPTNLHHILDVRAPIVVVRSMPPGSYVALIDRDSCDVYDLRSGKRTGFIKEAMQGTGDMKLISPDGLHLVMSRRGRGLDVRQTSGAARIVATIPAIGATPEPIGFFGKDQLVARLDAGGKSVIQIWDVNTGQMSRQFEIAGHSGGIALSPNGRLLAAILQGSRLHVYDVESGLLVGEREIPGQVTTVLAMSFSHDGSELACLYGDAKPAGARLIIWRVDDGSIADDVPVEGISRGKLMPEMGWLPDASGLLINGELFERSTGQRLYTIPAIQAGPMVGQPIRMLSSFHVLLEFVPSGAGDRVIYKSHALPRGDLEAALRILRGAPEDQAAAQAPAPAEELAGANLAAAAAPLAPVDPQIENLTRAKLAEGIVELDAGRAREAQQLFSEGIAAYGKVLPQKLEDETRINLYHGLAVAHLRLNELPKARQAMDRLRNALKTNRSMALNDALLDVLTRQNVMRGVGTLERILATGAIEEEVVNLYGLAISRVEADPGTRSRASVLWDKYRLYEAKLVPPTPGVRRWGSRWLTPSEYAPLEEQRKQAEANRETFRQRVQSLEDSLAQARVKSAAANAAYQAARGQSVRHDRLPYLAREANRTAAEVNRLRRELDRAKERLYNSPSGPKPTFEAPNGFSPVLELQLN